MSFRFTAGTFTLEAHDDVEVMPEAWWMHGAPAGTDASMLLGELHGQHEVGAKAA